MCEQVGAHNLPLGTKRSWFLIWLKFDDRKRYNDDIYKGVGVQNKLTLWQFCEQLQVIDHKIVVQSEIYIEQSNKCEWEN